MTLNGHKPYIISPSDREHHEYKHISCISYSSDGKQMISGSNDKTIRRWDLREGKEIEEAREVCEHRVEAMGVSKDGRWVVHVTAVGGVLKVSEVETGIVRTFYLGITCIDISTDSTLLAGASTDSKVRIWSLDTGELMAGPLEFRDVYAGALALRLSADSLKLAVMSNWGRCLQVWDVQAQKLDVQKSTPNIMGSFAPVFWTTKNKSIVVPFSFMEDFPRTIYEFDASTLETAGAPFKGHTSIISGLALSSDCALLASSSYDNTIKLWAFQSRQLLASFDVKSPTTLVLSPNSRQLAYTNWNDCNIYICNIPANILASIGSTNKSERSCRSGLLNVCGPALSFIYTTRSSLQSDATHRPMRRKLVIMPVMPPIPRPPRPLPTSNPHAYFRFLRKLPSSSRTDAIRTDEPRNRLDLPATSPLPRPLIKPDENSRSTPVPPTTQSPAINTSATLKSSLHQLSTWWPFRTDSASPTIVDVPLAPAQMRYATAGAPGDDDDLIRDEDYVSPPPSPNPGSRPEIVNAGQHGSGRFCFCF
ncbi:hypothetical protein EV702DRAFT_1277049 [Suillus placidus]|uniref:WD40 repeat-like protein n=1 Tax=Suillus placidus TaxID=48579 RepID=A0A9P6ZZB5_9AGAM|nr:hypothetical protein EV702DRAFT_1277049 [Suillus placidus]